MAQERILFSIIIPTYNSAKTLGRCLESIVGQRYPHIEVWLIDGLSDDKTLEIIKTFQEKVPYIHYLTEKDKGIYDAMNKGIDKATGDWLYFLGSDDILHNEHVLAKLAREIAETNAGIIYGSVLMRGKNNWNLENVVFDGRYNTEKFIDRNICHQAIFYSRSVIQEIGYFNLRYITNADFDFNLRCYARYAFTYIDLIIADFFVGGHSTNVEDHLFRADRGALLYRYFGRGIYTKAFIGARLYLQQAGFSGSSPLNTMERLYCVAACLKLKVHAMLLNFRSPTLNFNKT